jgi:hypothetical protein
MINKILAITLSVIYMTLSIGFPVTMHHCHEQDIVAVSFISQANCQCAVQFEEEISCCTHQSSLKQNSHLSFTQKECCTFETKIIKWETKQQLAQKQIPINKIAKIDLFTASLNIDSVAEDSFLNYNIGFFVNPPPIHIPLEILNQEFILYG